MSSIVASKFSSKSSSPTLEDRSIASDTASGASGDANDVAYHDIADADAPLDRKTGRNITVSKQVLHRPSDRRRNGTVVPSDDGALRITQPSVITGPGSTVSKTIKSIRQEPKKKNKGGQSGYAQPGVDGSKALMEEAREYREIVSDDVTDIRPPVRSEPELLVDASRPPTTEIHLIDLIKPRKTRGLARDFEIIPHTKSVLAFNEDDPISPIRTTRFDLGIYAYDDSDWDVIDDPDLRRPNARKTYAAIVTKA